MDGISSALNPAPVLRHDAGAGNGAAPRPAPAPDGALVLPRVVGQEVQEHLHTVQRPLCWTCALPLSQPSRNICGFGIALSVDLLPPHVPSYARKCPEGVEVGQQGLECFEQGQ